MLHDSYRRKPSGGRRSFLRRLRHSQCSGTQRCSREGISTASLLVFFLSLSISSVLVYLHSSSSPSYALSLPVTLSTLLLSTLFIYHLYYARHYLSQSARSYDICYLNFVCRTADKTNNWSRSRDQGESDYFFVTSTLDCGWSLQSLYHCQADQKGLSVQGQLVVKAFESVVLP